MNTGIKLRYSDSIDNKTLRMHPKLAKKMRITRPKMLQFKFGDAAYPIVIQITKTVRVNEIIMSKGIWQRLRIPNDCAFQLRKIKNTLLIGPYIGILFEKENKKKFAQDLATYAKLYPRVGGALLAFHIKDINTRARTIKGRMYNPVTRSWEKGKYYYPSSVFNKAWTEKSLIDHFEKCLGKTIFNGFRWDKWMMHTKLSRKSNIRYILPKTKLYRKPSDVVNMLQNYPELYIKPVVGSNGNHIWKVIRKRNNITLSHRNYRSFHKSELFTSMRGLTRYLRKKLPCKKCLIQKGIKLISSKGRLIDFRMVSVKDKYGNWTDMGLFARYGSKHSIVSNISAGGIAEEGSRTLKKVLRLSEKEIGNIRNRMFIYMKRVASQIESSGLHAGNLGIDFALDINKKIWIIEVNHNNPDHTIALDAGKRKIYLNTIKANLLYAKKLAGFS